MAVPKKKTSHRKQHQRRANWKAEKISYGACSNCGSPQLPHMACTSCGYYNGREYLKAMPKSARKDQENIA